MPVAHVTVVWTPAGTGQEVIGGSYYAFLSKVNDFYNSGYRLQMITSHVAAGKVIYSATGGPGGYGQALRLDQSPTPVRGRRAPSPP